MNYEQNSEVSFLASNPMYFSMLKICECKTLFLIYDILGQTDSRIVGGVEAEV